MCVCVCVCVFSTVGITRVNYAQVAQSAKKLVHVQYIMCNGVCVSATALPIIESYTLQTSQPSEPIHSILLIPFRSALQPSWW